MLLLVLLLVCVCSHHQEADKATVFRTAVEYLTFLKSRLHEESLLQLDQDVRVWGGGGRRWW